MYRIDWAERSVLVAGGAGFVGSMLVRLLRDKGARVISLDDYSTGSLEHLPNEPSIISIESDACDYAAMKELFRRYKIEFVFHAIGDTFVPDAYDFPKRFFDRNLTTTLNLLQAAHSSKTVERFLYISSTEVYGEIDQEYADETVNLLPLNTYAVSKLAADRLCHTFHLEHGLPVVVARIFNCYGPRATHPYIIPEIIRQLHGGTTLQLGNIEAERDFTYVEDTALALIAVMESSIPNGEVVNVGSGHTYSVKSLVDRISHILNIENVTINLDSSRLRRRDIARFCADNRKLITSTGWKPKTMLDEGLEKSIDWFRANGNRWNWKNEV